MTFTEHRPTHQTINPAHDISRQPRVRANWIAFPDNRRVAPSSLRAKRN
jgi:hypothetical protein